MEMTEQNKEAPKHVVGGPFAWLVQSTMERNPPHGWAVHMFNGQQVRDAVPVYLKQEVDRLRSERDDHARWRQELGDDLGECERIRDVLARTVNVLKAKGDMLAAVVQGAKEEFVRVPYGASHEDVAAINDWHRMADEALEEWTEDEKAAVRAELAEARKDAERYRAYRAYFRDNDADLEIAHALALTDSDAEFDAIWDKEIDAALAKEQKHD